MTVEMMSHELSSDDIVTEFLQRTCRRCPPSRSQHALQDALWSDSNVDPAVSPLDLWIKFDSEEVRFTVFLYRCSLSARSFAFWITLWTKLNSALSVYFAAVAFLHVASRLLRHDLSDELIDILVITCGLQFADIRHNCYHSTSLLSLNIATKLMKVVANKSLSTMSLIEIELSKAYLHRALRCKDSDSDSIYCLANVYLAVLYYAKQQFQTAMDHCMLTTRLQNHSQYSSHVVQGEILPKIDNDVDNMLGLAQLYQSVQTVALKRQLQSLSIFTTKLFAYYLHIKHLAITNRCQYRQMLRKEFKRYGACISDTPQLFISDVLLFLTVSRLLKFQHKSVRLNSECSLTNASRCNTSELVELLQKSAVEHLTAYRQLMVREVGSVATIVATDFEALYTYKHGDYQRCLQLSTQNVHTLLYARRMPNVLTFPEFIQLMDDDIVSLTALTLIVNPECRKKQVNSCINQLTLSLYLMAQCQLKLQYSVTSLAQTLHYIKVAQKKRQSYRILDQLTLKLIQCQLKV